MDGFINFFKHGGVTSNKALGALKRAIGTKKAGFLGTLDPIASGILPVALGRGTKLLPYFENKPKGYRATMIFGSETDTQDSSGTVTKTGDFSHVTREGLLEAFSAFTGEIGQIPPMYSAKKVEGKRLYEIARKGGEVTRKEKLVTVHSLELEEFFGTGARFHAVVSSGTYIRTLCEDIGRHLKSAAHMGDLIRDMVHNFTPENSWTLEKLEERGKHPEEWLLPLDFPLGFLPRHEVSPREQKDLSHGAPIAWVGKEEGPIRLYDGKGNFIGVGRADLIVRKILPEKVLYNIPSGQEVRTRRFTPSPSR